MTLRPWLMELHSGKLTWQWELHHLKMYLLLEMVVFHCYGYQRQRVMPVMQSLFASFAGTCPYARCQCENIPSNLKSPKSAPRCFESTICLFSLVYIRKCQYINLNNRSHTPYMYLCMHIWNFGKTATKNKSS